MAHFHVMAGAGERLAFPSIQKIGLRDLRDALSKGIADFTAMPSHYVFLAVIYLALGFLIARATYDNDLMPLLYPILGGYALLGPLVAIGLYEMSRRRELGLDTAWKHAFEVFRSPSIGAIGALALLFMAIFLAWLGTAHALYQSIFGLDAAKPFGELIRTVLFTPEGHRLFIVGNILGGLFAVLALVVGVVSFPLLVDRDAGAAVALTTSVRAVLHNPLVMAAWGLIVAGALLIGALTLFVGLAVVMPVLGHATWHLYRRVVKW